MSSNYKSLYSISNRHNLSKYYSFKENFEFKHPNLKENIIMVQERSYNKDDPNVYNQANLYPKVNPNYSYIENKNYFPNTKKIKKLGWKPKYNIEQCIEKIWYYYLKLR